MKVPTSAAGRLDPGGCLEDDDVAPPRLVKPVHEAVRDYSIRHPEGEGGRVGSIDGVGIL